MYTSPFVLFRRAFIGALGDGRMYPFSRFFFFWENPPSSAPISLHHFSPKHWSASEVSLGRFRYFNGVPESRFLRHPKNNFIVETVVFPSNLIDMEMLASSLVFPRGVHPVSFFLLRGALRSVASGKGHFPFLPSLPQGRVHFSLQRHSPFIASYGDGSTTISFKVAPSPRNDAGLLPPSSCVPP